MVSHDEPRNRKRTHARYKITAGCVVYYDGTYRGLDYTYALNRDKNDNATLNC